ncbi:hypothetical protein [Cerasicoccus maritimus]|uniref:hypothetical protein n=1 Tax=Cerasicoccus maritimus TaxID=490089 RepID=UPI00285295EB|nr:hypothetical protein [Cerasicoccus maritimus]
MNMHLSSPILAALYAILLLTSRTLVGSGFGDTFSYQPGRLAEVSKGLWYDSQGTSDVSVNANQGATLNASTSNTLTRRLQPLDDSGDLQHWPSDTIFARFKLTVNALPEAGDGEYFLCFSDSTGSHHGLIFIKRDNSSSFRLGVSYSDTIPSATTGTAYSEGETLNLIVSLNKNTHVTKLWVNPLTEASSSISSNDIGPPEFSDLIVLRQSNQQGGIGGLVMDDLIIGENFSEVSGKIIDVTAPTNGPNFAMPDDTIDDGPGLRQAIAAAQQDGGPCIILFPYGTYRITETDSSYVSYDGGVYRYASVVDNIDNLVIQGSDSTLLITSATPAPSGFDYSDVKLPLFSTVTSLPSPSYSPYYSTVSPFHFAHCDNLTIKNLLIEWERPSVTIGTVGTVQTQPPISGYSNQWQFTVSVAGPPLTNSYDWAVIGLVDVDPISGLPLSNVSVKDKSTTNYLDWSINSNLSTQYTITVRSNSGTSGDNADLTEHLIRTFNQLEGKKVALHHPSGGALRGPYGPPSMAAYRNTNMKIQDVTLASNVGMGIQAGECTDLTFDRIKLQPSKGALISTAKDGIFLSLCHGDIVMRNCTFEATGDDSVNLHGAKFLNIQSTVPSNPPFTLTCSTADGSFTGPVPKAGQQFEFYNQGNEINAAYTSGSSNFHATVISASANGSNLTITFDNLPAGLKTGDSMCCVSDLPTLSVENCSFIGSFARGLIISTQNATITNSKFENIAFNGIYLLADMRRSGAQAPGMRNLVVSQCEFSGCGAAPIATFSPSYNPTSRPSAAGMFRDFTITNNIFRPESESNINSQRLARLTSGNENEDVQSAYMQAALLLSGLGGTNLIKDNLIYGTGPNDGFSPAIFLNHTEGVSIINNQASGMHWQRTMEHKPVLNTPGEIPNFGATPTNELVDYLVQADETEVNGFTGEPQVLDSDLFGYPRQLGDIQ